MKAEKAKVNREFKDGMFRTLFNDKEKMLELYNAVSDEQMGKEAIDDIDNGVATICESRLMGLLMQRFTSLPFWQISERNLIQNGQRSTMCEG